MFQIDDNYEFMPDSDGEDVDDDVDGGNSDPYNVG